MTVIIQETIFQRAERLSEHIVSTLPENNLIEAYGSVERAKQVARNAFILLDRHKRGLMKNERQ